MISKKTEKITNLITKIFNNEPETEIVLTDLPVVPAAKAITPEKKVVINQSANNQNKNEQNKNEQNRNKQASNKEKKVKKDNEDIEILEEDLAKEVLPTKINSAIKINSAPSSTNQKDVTSKTSSAKTQNLATTNQETISITKTNIAPQLQLSLFQKLAPASKRLAVVITLTIMETVIQEQILILVLVPIPAPLLISVPRQIIIQHCLNW